MIISVNLPYTFHKAFPICPVAFPLPINRGNEFLKNLFFVDKITSVFVLVGKNRMTINCVRISQSAACVMQRGDRTTDDRRFH